MSIPTPLEATGNYTTSAEQTQWLSDVAADSGRVSVTTIGTTVGGKPIEMAGIGSTPPSPASSPGGYFVVAYQHGDEPGSREGALTLIRELAYTTEPALTAYLADHPVFVVPSVNADQVYQWVRHNLNDVDTNRDFIALTQPETRAAQEAILQVRPALVHDMHEIGDQAYDVSVSGTGNPETGADISALAVAIRAHTYAHLDAVAITHGDYPVQFFPTLCSNSAGLRHMIPLVTETRRAETDRLKRAKGHRETALGAIDYHRLNTAAVSDAIAASKAAALTPDGTFQLGQSLSITLPTYYRLTESQRAANAYTLDSFGIQMTADGTNWIAPTAQQAGPIIPYMMDPASSYRVLSAEPYSPIDYPPIGEATAFGPMRVGGLTCTVSSISIQTSGVLQEIYTA